MKEGEQDVSQSLLSSNFVSGIPSLPLYQLVGSESVGPVHTHGEIRQDVTTGKWGSLGAIVQVVYTRSEQKF